jgi:predicted nucleic acid-binding protein
MGSNRPTLAVFVDSSVLFTAVNSLSGGSAKLFTLDRLKLISSPVVLAETERNVLLKLTNHHLKRFFTLTHSLTIFPLPINSQKISLAESIIHPKDAVILVQAKHSQAEYLVTLDIKHFFIQKVSLYLKPQQVVTPKDLIAIYQSTN